LVSTPDNPPEDIIPNLLTVSDVMGTGWFAAHAANVKPGSTVAVVGDGAVGVLGVLSAKEIGAERIIAMTRHESRQSHAPTAGCRDPAGTEKPRPTTRFAPFGDAHRPESTQRHGSTPHAFDPRINRNLPLHQTSMPDILEFSYLHHGLLGKHSISIRSDRH